MATLSDHQTPTGFGLPLPEDTEAGRLDLNALLMERPEATFFLRARGDAMREAGILDGDLMVVDRSRTPADGNIVIAVIDDELVVKRLRKRNGGIALEAANPASPAIVPQEGVEFRLWGVVRAAVRLF